jgi:hypothetical protein
MTKMAKNLKNINISNSFSITIIIFMIIIISIVFYLYFKKNKIESFYNIGEESNDNKFIEANFEINFSDYKNDAFITSISSDMGNGKIVYVDKPLNLIYNNGKPKNINYITFTKKNCMSILVLSKNKDIIDIISNIYKKNLDKGLDSLNSEPETRKIIEKIEYNSDFFFKTITIESNDKIKCDLPTSDIGYISNKIINGNKNILIISHVEQQPHPKMIEKIIFIIFKIE